MPQLNLLELISDDLIPVRKVGHEMNNNFVVLKFKNSKKGFIDKLFFKNKKEVTYKIDLDEIGSFIWLLIDGKKSVNSLINFTSEKFGEKVEPVDQRVKLFLKQMNDNHLIILFKKEENKSINS